MERDEFCRKFKDLVDKVGMSDEDLSRELQISLPTIVRWKRAEAAPHPVGREPVIKFLEQRMK